MPSALSTIAVLGSLATSVMAHGFVSGFRTDGEYHENYTPAFYYLLKNTGSFPDVAGWYAENLERGFVAPSAYGTTDINCHVNAKPGAISATVAAGGSVEFLWNTDWPHDGPIFTYVAKCDGDCSTADPDALRWVKIDEDTIDIATQKWATSRLVANNGTWVTEVPATLAAGNYVFRNEIIGVHGSTGRGGAQNYPQCINIAITGSGTDNPVGVAGTALYKEDDPGILFNPYTTITEYISPGPALYKPGGSSNPAPAPAPAPVPTTSAAPAPATSSAAVEPPAAATSSVVPEAPATTSAAVVAPQETESAAPVVPTPASSSSAAAAVPTKAPVEAEKPACPNSRRKVRRREHPRHLMARHLPENRGMRM